MQKKDEDLEAFYAEKKALFSAAEEFKLVIASPEQTPKPKKVSLVRRRRERTSRHNKRQKREFSLIPVDVSTDIQPVIRSSNCILDQTLPDSESFYDVDLSSLPSSNSEYYPGLIRQPPDLMPFMNSQDDMEQIDESLEQESETQVVSQLPPQDISTTNTNPALKEPVSQETALQVPLQATGKSDEISGEVYSEQFREAYADYLEEEKLLGSTDIWTMQQFHDLVWILTGFE